MVNINENKNERKKNLRWWMRNLHNKIGFFIVCLVVIYALSGLLQTYRDTDLLKQEVIHEEMLDPDLPASQLGSELRLENMKIVKREGTVLYFKEGFYDEKTGLAEYTTKDWYWWLEPFTELHKSSSKSTAHYFTMLFAIALLFMCISAFWMFKPGTKLFSSGVWLTVAGVIGTVLLMILY